MLPGCVPVGGAVPVAGLGAVLPGWLPAVVGPGLVVTPVSVSAGGMVPGGVVLGWFGRVVGEGGVVLSDMSGDGAVVVGMPGFGVVVPGVVVPPGVPVVCACADRAAIDSTNSATTFFMEHPPLA